MNEIFKEKEDPEDIMKCQCYMIFCISKNGNVYTDRVYLTKELAVIRKDYLQLQSQDRGVWHIALSELGN